jgi:TPR repeat protein
MGDGDWIRDAMLERETFNRQLSSVCQQSIDKGEVDTWVTASAAQGDPQSHYMLAMFGPRNNRNEQFVVAAQAGVPWAQFGLAQLMFQGVTPAPGISNASEKAGDLLRAAAVDLPQAKSDLAQCEFRGCTDIPVDIPSAVTDAREAAERGAFEAMLEIGPQLQASQIDPDEVEAWNLVHAALEMQGSAGMALSVQVVKSASSVLNSPTITTKARTLAEEYWREYGTQMLRNLGCGP